MSSNKSKIVIGGISTLVLGFLLGRLAGKKLYKDNEKIITKPAETGDKIKTVNDIIAHYSSPDELLFSILDDCISKKSFTEPKELLKQTILRFSIECDDYSWFETVPTDIEGLEEFLRSYGLYGKYKDILFPKN